MFDGVRDGDGVDATVLVNIELVLKGEDDVSRDTSVISSNFTFRSMLRNDNGKLWDGSEEHVLSNRKEGERCYF